MTTRLPSRIGSPVRHVDRVDMVGTVLSYYWERGRIFCVVDWISEGFAPNIPANALIELPSEMHLIASA